MSREYGSFREFYPDYLAEHSQPMTRRLHVVGLLAAIAVLVGVLWTGRWAWVLAAPVLGYGASWVGHFVFERGEPIRHVQAGAVRLAHQFGDLALQSRERGEAARAVAVHRRDDHRPQAIDHQRADEPFVQAVGNRGQLHAVLGG